MPSFLGAAGEQEENGLGASASGPARTLTQNVLLGSRVVSQKVNFLGQGNKGGSSRLPLGEERANILLLACCYQEGWPRAAIQSVSLELFIAISVACGDICPRAAGPACRRVPPSPRNTCCAAQNRVVPIARRGPGRKTRPARPPCCGWPASWSISPSRGRKNSRVTRLCARTWLEFRAAALKSRPAGDPADKGSPRIQTVAFCRTLDWDSPLGPRLTIAPTPAGLVGITGESPPARLLHAGG